MTLMDEVGEAIRNFNEAYKDASLEKRKRFWMKLLDMTQEQNQEFIKKNFGDIN